MKKRLLITSALAALIPFQAIADDDVVKVSGSACEIFNNGQSKSSVRVRVTDKASYNAVSQIPSLAELRSQMLEHDYNVIVYNLVDNYVQNMSVRTTSQDNNELCVEVTGAIPAADIVTVIANYSPANPAPEYDFKKANGIITEKAEPFKENKPSEAAVMYNGPKEFDKIAEPSKAEIAYQPEQEPQPQVQAAEEKEVLPKAQKIAAPAVYVPEDNDVIPSDSSVINQEPTPIELDKPKIEPKTEPVIEEPVIEEPAKALIYIAPVEFNNNTHTSKPLGVLKEFFANEDLYTLLDNPDGADYTISSKVLKAKIDSVNQKTKRMQMVVSVELKINGADGSISDHQNRFVLFDSSENEQEVAMNLLKKLLQKSGEKLIARVEQNESKRADRPFLIPAKSSSGL